MPEDSEIQKQTPQKPKLSTRLRNYFLTGILVTSPPAVTIYLVVLLVNFIDDKVRALLPGDYIPEEYLPFAIPGSGLVFVSALMILIGAFTTGYVGRLLYRIWEKMWERMPFVSGIYTALKQIFETVFSQKTNAFRQVVLVEFPRQGAWTIAFVTADTSPEIKNALNADDFVTVYVPTTPNPTSGYLMLYRKNEIKYLNMSVEDGLKLLISLGIVAKKK